MGKVLLYYKNTFILPFIIGVCEDFFLASWLESVPLNILRELFHVCVCVSHSCIFESGSAESTAVQQIFNHVQTKNKGAWALLKVERKYNAADLKKKAERQCNTTYITLDTVHYHYTHATIISTSVTE